jgi:hypothetical protein
MNYNINIEQIENEKIIIPKKNYYCSNCNRKGHTFKNCNEPIISNGIIGIYIENFDIELIPYLEDYIIKNLKIFNNYNFLNIKTKNKTDNKTDNNNYNNNYCTNNNLISKNLIATNKNIKFLMVQRKNSLGYLEFMRGRYNLDNIKTITHLLEQMTPEELDDIINIDFDILWNNLWDSNNIRNKNHHKEYISSKQKFYQLKLINIDILKNTKPLFSFNEWGFPKGRRESYESDLVCAVREFEEETMLNENNYIILEKCKAIRENLTGTNGINYAHNYFISILNDIDDNTLKTNKITTINREIGQKKILDINECLEKIRPYHKNKIRIIKSIYEIVNNFVKEYSKIQLIDY